MEELFAALQQAQRNLAAVAAERAAAMAVLAPINKRYDVAGDAVTAALKAIELASLPKAA